MTTSGLILRAACLSVALSTACHAQPQSPVSAARGIYVAFGPRPARDEGARQVAFTGPAGGVYLRTRWSTIQPAANSYDWRELDENVAAARRAGKRISIGVRAGAAAPEWLLASVPTSTFVFGRRRGTAGVCSTIRIAHPWSKGYTDAYGRMIGALASHLRATGAYRDVAIVKLTGINTQSEELRLPSARSPDDPPAGSCAISDAPPIWRQAGYRPDKVLAAWKTMAGAVGAAFPDKLLSLPLIDSNDFPTTDASGAPVRRTDPAFVDVKGDIVRTGARMFPGRFAVQWNGLNNRGQPKLLGFAKSAGALIGLQSNHRGGPGGGAGCNLEPRVRPDPCTPQEYRATLAQAKRAGAVFVEIWPEDASQFGEIVAETAKSF